MSEETKNPIVEAIQELKSGMAEMKKGFEAETSELRKKMDEKSEIQAPNIRKSGRETTNSSRPFSLGRLAVALTKRQQMDTDWDKGAVPEIDLCRRVAKAYGEMGEFAVPLSSALMPVDDMEDDEGNVTPGFTETLRKECSDVFEHSLSGLDISEVEKLRKDLSVGTAGSGGVLVGPHMQGELINQLLAAEVFGQLGTTNLPLPSSGKMTFPRRTSGVSIAAYSESEEVSESTPAFGSVSLEAKKYAGLVDMTEEFMKFVTSVAGEALLRQLFVEEMARDIDRDFINGSGGKYIQGLITQNGFRTVIASTTGASGDTLDPEDPTRLVADIADQNAPIDSGVFFACTNSLWAGLSTRKDSQGSFVFNHSSQMLGGGQAIKTMDGHRVVTSTQIPTDRVKTVSNLTLLLCGVAREMMVGRAGAIQFATTSSDGEKFRSGISTMRATQFVDMVPRHAASFGMIDTLVNS